MKPPKRRPFAVLDAMILVAATALGFSLTSPDALTDLQQIWREHPETNLFRMFTITSGVRSLASVWLAWTFALGILRLRRPRPPLRELADQPGSIVAVVILTMFLLALASNLGETALAMIGHDPPDQFPWYRLRPMLMWQILILGPPALIGGWLTLGISGRWQPESSWIDRMGRVLGWG